MNNARTFYVKDYKMNSIALYFENIPSLMVRNELKERRWRWNPEKMCWQNRFTSETEAFAKSLGAVDGTEPNKNPSIHVDGMDIEKVRNGMVKMFGNDAFRTYSMKQISDFLKMESGTAFNPVNLDRMLGVTKDIVWVMMANKDNNVAIIKVTGVKEKQDETSDRYWFGTPFAQKIIRALVFQKPYILFNSDVYRIFSYSDTPMINRMIQHTRYINSLENYAEIWVYKLKMPCNAHADQVQSVTAYVKTNKSMMYAPINVAYCPVCQKYYINAEQYNDFAKRYGLPFMRIQTVETDDHIDYAEWRQESVLHYMGYNVSSMEGLSAEQRHTILKHIIDTGTLTKVQVISFLEFLSYRNRNRLNYASACYKWKSDVEYIRNYKMDEQDGVKGNFRRKY